MSAGINEPLLPGPLADLLRGEPLEWRALGLTSSEILDRCSAHELTGLLHQRIRDAADRSDWPPELRETVEQRSRGDAAYELVRRSEVVSALDALAAAGVQPVLIKGAALAYSVYDAPSARPRDDTDLLLPRHQVDIARDVMRALGYAPTVYCDGELVLCQFEMRKIDGHGVDHAFDFHWKISTQTLFADLLSYEELAAGAVAVPALGVHARAAGPLHALLLAVIHPAMHHRNRPRALWLYDVHLLVSSWSDAEWHRFADLAIAKKVSAIVADQLSLARALWRTPMSDAAIERLEASAAPEPSASYLRPHRRWEHELVANVRGLPDWSGRVRLLREVLFPSTAYMRRSYRLTSGARTALLPALYLHRLVHGAGKLLRGRK